jgi:beta-glucosidase
MNEQEKIIQFPEGFLWGVSTAPYQIEGNILCDWSQWEMSPKRLKALRNKKLNYHDFVAGQACDSYHRFTEDAQMAQDLGCGGYRLGVEWARIEPREDEFDYKEIGHYREVLMDLKVRNIKVVLTLWHWTNPMWVVDMGGWANKKTVAAYAKYVEFIVTELGDLVDFWITINEPTIHVNKGYITGEFPPNKKNPILAAKTFFNLASAHKRAYEIIHKTDLRARVGFTHLGDNFYPAHHWFFPEIFLAWLFNAVCNNFFIGLIKKEIDFIGLDYYFSNRVVWYPPFLKNLNKEVTDFGWEILPEGIYGILKDLRRFNKPIYIMENGIADVNDSKRAKFIVDHLRWVYKAIEEGEDVRGYFHWSLLDNFEWAQGWRMKFGLYSLNRETFERIPRPSASVYADICRTNSIAAGKTFPTAAKE